MKKNIIIAILAFVLLGGTSAFAQDETGDAGSGALVNKKGFTILPQAGDIAIGVTAAPFLNYLGNFFCETGVNASPSLNFLDNNEIFVKYYLTDESAMRFRLQFDNSNGKDRYYVQDDQAVYIDPNSMAQVVDINSYTYYDYTIGAGYEMHRGETRLQGYYGAELNFSVGSGIERFTYGNPMSDVNQLPTMAWPGNEVLGGRITEYDYGKSYEVGALLFLGVEYFFTPKICFGGEFGLQIETGKSTQEKIKYDVWSTDAGAVVNQAYMYSPGDSFFSTYKANPAANLYVMFHF